LIFHGANGAAKKVSDNARDHVFTPLEITNTKDIQDLGSIQFYPNPSNGSTLVNYDVQSSENLVLTIADIKGQIVSTHPLDANQKSFLLETKWQAGIYIANIFSGNKLVATDKLLVK